MAFMRRSGFSSRSKNAVRNMVAKAIKPKQYVPKAVKRYVQKKIERDAEDHYFDFQGGVANASITGSIQVLSAVAQGDGFAARTGEVINPISLQIRGDIKGSDTATTSYNVRIIVFQDKQIRSSALPTAADVLEDVSGNTDDVFSPLNHVSLNAKRFNILMDRTYLVDPRAPNYYTKDSAQRLVLFKKLRGKIVYTNTSTGTQKGNIYMLILSDTATNGPSVNFWSRLRFDDF